MKNWFYTSHTNRVTCFLSFIKASDHLTGSWKQLQNKMALRKNVLFKSAHTEGKFLSKPSEHSQPSTRGRYILNPLRRIPRGTIALYRFKNYLLVHCEKGTDSQRVTGIVLLARCLNRCKVNLNIFPVLTTSLKQWIRFVTFMSLVTNKTLLLASSD